ncbi:hypothetical protein FKX85_13470 [Echinicola soli]|uniref:Uncharacterized protein n=1 Tax=Echinicola soli TaxID=2591634 RepID=A0A514CJN6_9BACT|nr:hypothetical protein [Echinicola soli]QDH79986.1 hypothetical protein FKX85_13470 [Echinicola soli]
MNYNLLSYLVYLPFSALLTWWVGKELYSNGRDLLEEVLSKYALVNWLDPVNKSLLTGYYLINIGYVFNVTYQWEPLSVPYHMVSSLTSQFGSILFILGALHIVNVLLLLWLNYRKTS